MSTAPGHAEDVLRFTLGLEIPIAVPPIRVWKALLEPEDMKNWFCQHAEVETRTGGKFVFGGRYTFRLDGPESEGQALVGFETGKSVTFSWDIGGEPTRVRFVLSSVRGDCRLRVYHHCAGEPHRDWRGDIADHHPWEVYLLNLKMYLERGTAGIRVDYDAIPEGRQSISGEVRCASERIWRVLTDREECSRRAGETLEFDPAAAEGWTEPFGLVEVVSSKTGRRLTQRWADGERGAVTVEWDLVSKGVSSVLQITSSGEGEAASWHTGTQGLWTHLVWCRVVNELKYYSETGSLPGLRRLTGDF